MKNIIWNINRICAYNCPICCIDAYCINKNNFNLINISSNSLKKTITIESTIENIYEEANLELQKRGLELLFSDKIKIIDNIDIPVTLDFSGGDPLLLEENLEVIRYASKKFGKNNISISTTGIGLLKNDNISKLNKFVNNIEFTYDFPKDGYINRPNNYNNHNLKQITKLSNLGINFVAQVSLSKENISKEIITQIYKDLKKVKVNEIFLMKIFPVGRGSILIKNEPTKEQYQYAIQYYKTLEKKYNYPKISIQSILNYSYSNKKTIKEKYLISKSLNVTNLGYLSLSPWAYDSNGNIFPKYIIGNLIENKLSKLYNSNNFIKLYKRLLNKI